MKSFSKFFLFISIFFTSAWLFSACGKKSSSEQVVTPMPKTESIGEKIDGKFKDLLAMNKSLRCTWKVTDEGMSAESVMYIQGNKYKSTVIVPNNEASDMTIHSLSDGEWIYIWNEGAEAGMKIKPDEFENTEEDQEAAEYTQEYQMMLDKDNEFECKPWMAESKVFDLPEGIEFQDFNKELEALQQSAEDMKESLKGMCDLLSGEEREQCISDLE